MDIRDFHRRARKCEKYTATNLAVNAKDSYQFAHAKATFVVIIHSVQLLVKNHKQYELKM